MGLQKGYIGAHRESRILGLWLRALGAGFTVCGLGFRNALLILVTRKRD